MDTNRRSRKFLFTTLLIAMLTLPLIAAAPSTGWLSMWGPTVSGCSFTVTAQWVGVNGAKTLELWLTQNPTYNGQNDVRIAQLLDAHGNPIPGTLDFTGYASSYCTSP
jgi:hypothetical protein